MSPEGAKIVAEEMQRKRDERAALETTCCSGTCDQGRTCPQRCKRTDQGQQGPRSQYRWPAGIGAHAIALCVLAAVAAVGWLIFG